MRCFGLTSPRHDGKLGLHLPDLGGYEEEWDVDALPWDAVTSVPPGDQHPPTLDEGLVAAIISRALKTSCATDRSQAAAVAFLYLYMSLAHDGLR